MKLYEGNKKVRVVCLRCWKRWEMDKDRANSIKDEVCPLCRIKGSITQERESKDE